MTRTLTVGTDQLTEKIVDWLNEHDCEIEEGDVALVRLPHGVRVTDLNGNHVAIDFPISLGYLDAEMVHDVVKSWRFVEV
jgi:hypothetical protein